MNPRERILAVYRNESPDRMPVGIYNRYHRIGEAERSARNAGVGILHFRPVVSLLAPPWHMQPGYVSEVTGAKLTVRHSWEEGKPFETRTIETPIGTVVQRSTKDQSYGSDWIVKHYLETPEDYRVMRYVVENTVLESLERDVLSDMERLGGDGVVLGRMDRSPYQRILTELAGPENLFATMADAPGPVDELIRTMTVRADEQLERALDSAIEIVWQPDNITADLTPPETFRRYCLPFYREHGRRCREAGKIYAVHMDGRLGPLRDLISACPIDVIESFSLPEVGGDMTLREALGTWPNHVICPNIPAPLCLRGVKQIHASLAGLVEEVDPARPFMLQISEDIPIGRFDKLMEAITRLLLEAD